MLLKILSKINPIINSHDGREKCIRFVQYFCVFYIPYLTEKLAKLPKDQHAPYLAIIKKLDALCVQTGMTRNLFFVGMYIGPIMGIIARTTNKNVKWDTMFHLQNISHLSLTACLMSTHLSFFANLRILEWDPKRMGL